MDSTRKKVEKNYPQFFNEKLPSWIGCATAELKDVAKKAFERVCFKDAIVVHVENIQRNDHPVCIWRVYYQRKNEDDQYEEGDPNIPPVQLPSGGALKQFFEDIIKQRQRSMEVWQKYLLEPYTVVVDYYLTDCECQPQDFNLATIAPRLWSVEEAEFGMKHLKIINV